MQHDHDHDHAHDHDPAQGAPGAQRYEMSRILNFIFIEAQSPDAERFTFFVDSGLSPSMIFTRDPRARQLPIFSRDGAYMQPKPPVFNGLEDLCGSSIDGVIGLSTLTSFAAVSFNWDTDTMTLYPEQPPRPEGGVTLRTREGFSIDARLMGASTWPFLDLGAPISVMSPPARPAAGAPIFRLSAPSAMGRIDVAITEGNPLSYIDEEGAEHSERVAVTYGAPTPSAHILGADWFTARNLHLDMEAERMTLTPRVTPQEPWGHLGLYRFTPHLLPQLNPAALHTHDRPFTALPSGGRPLARGLREGVEYRVKGLALPAGHQGANVLRDALYSATEAPLTLVGPDGEVTVPRVSMFE